VIDGVNGLLVEPTADELASAIHRLMTDQALAARLGREGRRIVTERWTLDAAAERLEAALEESLARGG
jgi:glycosyltransferase involved in cell wall biosynthesis